MEPKTSGVRQLVQDVLASFREPYSEDVIEDVCVAIEHNPRWRTRYDELCADLSTAVVNSSIGRHTKDITGRASLREVRATRTTLIKDYTKLPI